MKNNLHNIYNVLVCSHLNNDVHLFEHNYTFSINYVNFSWSVPLDTEKSEAISEKDKNKIILKCSPQRAQTNGTCWELTTLKILNRN